MKVDNLYIVTVNKLKLCQRNFVHCIVFVF